MDKKKRELVGDELGRIVMIAGILFILFYYWILPLGLRW